MLELLCQLIVLGYDAAAQLAKVASLPLAAPERLAWERERLSALARGDRSAFSDLYRAYAGLIYARVLLPLLKQPAAAEDVLAEAFERAHAKLREVRVGDKSIFFWLARIARNRAVDVMRKRKVERLAMTKLTANFEALAFDEPSAESAACARDEEHAAAARIKAALAALNPRYGEAVRLRIVEERPREQCAAALGVSVATFDVVLLRALRAFRKSWQELPSP